MEPVKYWAVIRFLYLKGHTPQETFNEMKATYREDAPSYDIVKHWHHQFKCGRTSVATAPIPGWPQSAIDEDTIRQIKAAILEDHHITLRQLAQDVKICVGSVEKIIHDHLHMQKVCARWIPRLLTPLHRQEWVNCSEALLAMCQKKQVDFFDRLITQDNTWVHHYDPETKVQLKQWKHFDLPPQKKARVQPSAGKVILTIFWDQHGVVMTDFLVKGTTITAEEIVGGYQKREAQDADERCLPPAGQRPGSQLSNCRNGSTVLWLWNPSPSSFFTSFRPWNRFWRVNVSQMMKHWFPKSSRGFWRNMRTFTSEVSKAA